MRAVLSVHDKTGLAEFAQGLVELGYELVSTGGTHTFLAERSLPVANVSDVTGFPEILDGRVKTLHPAIHGGLLARRDLAEHRSALAEHRIEPIDVLVGNLYPFEATVMQPGCTVLDALEQIDIGGPAMIRAAAKNFPGVIVVTSPMRYQEVLAALRDNRASEDFRRTLAAEAFQHVSTYDSLVAEYLRGTASFLPTETTVPGRRAAVLRYGENPHQSAAAYVRPSTTSRVTGVLSAHQLQGKNLSYNNILDADAAVRALRGIDEPACAIVKHTIPCGLAIREDTAAAFDAALASDPVSAFGGVVALNRQVDDTAAGLIEDVFFEVIVATSFADEAISRLATKKNLRLLQLDTSSFDAVPQMEVRSISGGFLVQDGDVSVDDPSTWSLVTRGQLPNDVRADLEFAWNACRHVKSNAIVLARNRALVGVGPGQPNRLDSVRIAIDRAGDRVRGSVLASDAFFPFSDGVEAAISAGVGAIVQPGGSIRDAEVIAACDSAGVPMLFTGTRHFLH